jgi:hypothetical protein
MDLRWLQPIPFAIPFTSMAKPPTSATPRSSPSSLTFSTAAATATCSRSYDRICRGSSAGLPIFRGSSARSRPDDQIFLIEAMGDSLADALQTARHLRELLATIAEPNVKLSLIDTLDGQGLRKLIVTARDLSGALEWTYAQCSLRLLELLGDDYLRRLIRHGDDLAFALNALAEESQSALLTSIGWARVAELTRNARDLALLLRAVPPSISVTLLDQYDRRQLVEIIGDRRAWTYLYNRIKADEAVQLLRKLGADDAL